MKRKLIFTTLFLFIINFLIFSQDSKKIKINSVNYKINGKTNENILKSRIKINTDRIFDSINDLLIYIDELKISYNSLRLFESVEIEYNLNENTDFSNTVNNTENNFDEHSDIVLADLSIQLSDSFSFLVLPYPKINSNNGASIYAKAKDTNFLGTLNTMDADITFQFYKNDLTSSYDYRIGGDFTYDFPFYLGNVKTLWSNDYEMYYTFGEQIPVWNGKTGLTFEFPLNVIKNNINLELYQKAFRDTKYIDYINGIYFEEEAILSLPIELFNNNKDIFTLTPYAQFIYDWSYTNQINNYFDLASPKLFTGTKFTAKYLVWENNFRRGYDFNATANISYNFMNNYFTPYIEVDFKGFYNFSNSENWFLKRIGLCLDFYYFNFINVADYPDTYRNSIGLRLRGIKDEQFIKDSITNKTFDICKTSSAFVLNLDMPIHLFTTKFKRSFFKYFNFDLQISPFIDIGLTHSDITKNYYSLYDGFYGVGMEVLVYPVKWSSFTFRASFAVDLGSALNFTDPRIRNNRLPLEYYLGFGLLY